MYVCRVPIAKAIDSVLNAVTFGKFGAAKKRYGYDDLYHLYLLVTLYSPTTRSNSSHLLERNQVFRITDARSGDYAPEKCETVRSLRGGMKFGDLMRNAVASEPDGEFWIYDPIKHNCQDAIKSILASNGLLTGDLDAFIKQDAKELLSNTASKFARSITDIAAIGDILISGKGIERRRAVSRLKKIHGAAVVRRIAPTLRAYGYA
jgi:hypothetical protein